MQIHQFRIGLTVYTLNPLLESFYQKRGEVIQVIAGLGESSEKVVVLFDGIDPPAEFLPQDLTTVKPMSYAQIRVHAAELQDKVETLEVETHNQKGHIDLLEAQAVERSRKLEMAQGLADEHAETIKRKDARILQANNQILRHEESLKTIRASNEVLRGTNESLMEKNANLERGLTAANAAVEAAQKSNDEFANEAAKQAEKVGAMERAHEATRTELVRVQDKHDHYQQRTMEKSHEIEVLENTIKHLKEQANLRDALIEEWERRGEKDTSIIMSLRSQIESLQSINESQKQMIDGHAPAMKKLQGELHKVTHQRDQHKANAAYWKEMAIQHGAVAGTPEGEVKRDFLGNPMTMQRRIEIIEAFLSKQFESFN